MPERETLGEMVEGAQAWSSPAGDLQGLSCGEALLKLAEGVELWHTFARDAYGTVGGEAASVTSGEPAAAVAASGPPTPGQGSTDSGAEGGFSGRNRGAQGTRVTPGVPPAAIAADDPRTGGSDG